MKKINVLIFLLVTLIPTYFLSGFLFLLFNKIRLITAIKRYYPSLTFEAFINGYPQIGKALLISFVISFFILLKLVHKPKQENLHGNAKFATEQDIKRMGLFGKTGFIIGKKNGKLLRYLSDQFLALSAPTRSGKGVSIVIPNLMDLDTSVVVNDPKEEAFQLTSKYRQQKLGQKVYLFNPFDYKTHRYNPLDYVSMNNPARADLELSKLAMFLYPETGKADGDEWRISARNLFMGLTFLLHDMRKKQLTDWSFTIRNIARLEDGFEGLTLDEHFTAMKEIPGLLSDKTKELLTSYINEPSDKIKSSIAFSFRIPLNIFKTEVVDYATSGSDFDFRRLRREKMTLYLCIKTDDLDIGRMFLNIFFNQLINSNLDQTMEENPKELKNDCFLLLDEFASLGTLNVMRSTIGIIAGYGLRFVPIFQAPSQLQESPPLGYGKHGTDTILSNIDCNIYFTPSKTEDAESYSKMLGDTTVEKASKSRNYNKSGSSRGESVSEAARRLMLPQEFLELDLDKEIIKMRGKPPILCDKAFFYNDHYFMDKFKSVSPTLQAFGKKLPTKSALDRARFKGELAIKL